MRGRKSTFSNSNGKKARVLTYRREEESQDPDYEEWGGANNDDEYDDDDGVSSSLKRYLKDIIGKMFLFCDSYFSIGFINCFLHVLFVYICCLLRLIVFKIYYVFIYICIYIYIYTYICLFVCLFDVFVIY